MKWVPSAPSTGSRGAGAARGGWPRPPSGRRHQPRNARRPCSARTATSACGRRYRASAAIATAARLPARIRHQRQQEAGRDHKAEHRHHQREDLLRCGQPSQHDGCDAADSGRNACRPWRCNACPTPRRRTRSSLRSTGCRPAGRETRASRHRRRRSRSRPRAPPSSRHARWRNYRRGRGCRHNACWRCPPRAAPPRRPRASCEGSPTLTKNSDMPTTSAQIRNEIMVGSTR